MYHLLYHSKTLQFVLYDSFSGPNDMKYLMFVIEIIPFSVM